MDPDATTSFARPPLELLPQELEVPVCRTSLFSRLCRCLCHGLCVRTMYSQVIVPLPYLLPPQSTMNFGKKTLVLDLDETLVHSSVQGTADPDLVFSLEIEDKTYSVFVNVRPGAHDFLQQMSVNYELVVFTASRSNYADKVLDLIDPQGFVSHRLYREHCSQRQEGIVKDLTLLGRDLAKVIIIDNSQVSFLLQPDNGIHIRSYHEGLDDELEQLYPLLQELIDVEDVRSVLRSQRKAMSSKVTVDLEEVRSDLNSPRLPLTTA